MHVQLCFTYKRIKTNTVNKTVKYIRADFCIAKPEPQENKPQEMRLLIKELISTRVFHPKSDLEMNRRLALHFLTPTCISQRVFHCHVDFTQHTVYNIREVQSTILGRGLHYSSLKVAPLNFSCLLSTEQSEDSSTLRER